jgi:hypothetical protein
MSLEEMVFDVQKSGCTSQVDGIQGKAWPRYKRECLPQHLVWGWRRKPCLLFVDPSRPLSRYRCLFFYIIIMRIMVGQVAARPSTVESCHVLRIMGAVAHVQAAQCTALHELHSSAFGVHKCWCSVQTSSNTCPMPTVVSIFCCPLHKNYKSCPTVLPSAACRYPSRLGRWTCALYYGQGRGGSDLAQRVRPKRPGSPSHAHPQDTVRL